MTDHAEPTKTGDADELDGDIFAVRVRVTPEQARELLESGEYDAGDHPRITQHPDGAGSLDLFVTQAQAGAIRERGMAVDVSTNQSSRARARIAELGEGDRYEGGKVTPRGIGRKIGGRSDRGGSRPGSERAS